MGLLSEFKSFALRGNVVDLAVGVVIGAGFGKIVSALVEQIIMPPLGLLIGGVDFSSWKISLARAVLDERGHVLRPAVEMGIGAFLNAIVQFTIIAFAIFIVVKVMNKLLRRQAIAPTPAAEVVLLTEIRDLLKEERRDAAR